MVSLLRSAYVKRGLIRPCVPTPLVKDATGTWVVGVTRYER